MPNSRHRTQSVYETTLEGLFSDGVLVDVQLLDGVRDGLDHALEHLPGILVLQVLSQVA